MKLDTVLSECPPKLSYLTNELAPLTCIWLCFDFQKQIREIKGVLEKPVREKACSKFVEQPIRSFSSLKQSINIHVRDFFAMSNDFVNDIACSFIHCKPLIKQLQTQFVSCYGH